MDKRGCYDLAAESDPGSVWVLHTEAGLCRGRAGRLRRDKSFHNGRAGRGDLEAPPELDNVWRRHRPVQVSICRGHGHDTLGKLVVALLTSGSFRIKATDISMGPESSVVLILTGVLA